MPSMGLTEWAYSLSESMLAEPLPRRWAHSLGVAKRACSLSPILGRDAELLEAAAVLHDVGYSPSIATTGFHPLDGARFLRDQEGLTSASSDSWHTTPARFWRLRSGGSGMNWRLSSSWSGLNWWMR